MNWTAILAAVGATVLLFLLFRGIRSNPEAFSKENLGKSLTTVGLLALLIIGVVAISVWYLKSYS